MDAPFSPSLGRQPEEPRFEPPTTRAPGFAQKELAALVRHPAVGPLATGSAADANADFLPRSPHGDHTLWATMLGLGARRRDPAAPSPPIYCLSCPLYPMTADWIRLRTRLPSRSSGPFEL